ncbi:MAG: MEDS domain-containing protein [Terriglobales bacterium]
MNAQAACGQSYHLRDLGSLRAGDHVCGMFRTNEEQQEATGMFLRDGIARGERIVYVASAGTREDICGSLQRAGIDAEACLARGQLQLRNFRDAYIHNGEFRPEVTFAFWNSELTAARAAGYSSLRVTGEMSWSLDHYSETDYLIEYEAKLNRLIPGSAYTVLCQYDLRLFPTDLALQVLYSHPTAVVGTELYDNFYYVPPEELLGKNADGAKLRRWLDCLDTRKRIETQLRGAAEELERRVVERTLELKQRNQELQDFVSIASHHLREPIRKIHTFAERLSGWFGAATQDNVQRLRQAARTALRLVDGLSQYAAVRPPGTLVSASLDKAVADVVRSLRRQLQQSGASLDLRPLPRVAADPAHMRELFRELLNNAILFRHASLPLRITVEADLLGDWCELHIADNGIGLHPKDAVQIFRPFRRLANHGGADHAGIGLAVCHKIARLYGGDISVTSEPGQGARFTVTLPVAPAS